MSDSELANDRTFLAWFRTAIALFGLGFVIAKVALIVDSGSGAVSDEALYTGVGVATVLCGAAVVIVGYVQHTKVWKHLVTLESDRSDVSPPRWARSMAQAAVVGSLVLSALLIVTT
jgi:putative membrane protein